MGCTHEALSEIVSMKTITRGTYFSKPTNWIVRTLHLDIDSDINDDDCNDIVVLVAAVGENLSIDGFGGSI